MTREEYKQQKEDTLSKFSPEFEQKCVNALHHKVLESLVYGTSPYTILEQILDNFEELQKSYTRYIEVGPPPIMIGTISDTIMREMIANKQFKDDTEKP